MHAADAHNSIPFIYRTISLDTGHIGHPVSHRSFNIMHCTIPFIIWTLVTQGILCLRRFVQFSSFKNLYTTGHLLSNWTQVILYNLDTGHPLFKKFCLAKRAAMMLNYAALKAQGGDLTDARRRDQVL
jgi:hypothetical protein